MKDCCQALRESNLVFANKARNCKSVKELISRRKDELKNDVNKYIKRGLT